MNDAQLPTVSTQWVREGERCISPAGWLGTVESVRDDMSPPVVRVRWDRTDRVGRVLITHLRRAE